MKYIFITFLLLLLGPKDPDLKSEVKIDGLAPTKEPQWIYTPEKRRVIFPYLPNITLSTLKAFPSAFGAGEINSGGRGQSFYTVDNLNNSGANSFREAVSSGNRIVIVRVEGIVNLLSDISPNGVDNVTVWGQFAPGRGITLSGDRVRVRNSENHIWQHITFQNKKLSTNTSAFAWSQDETGYTKTSTDGAYFDNLSVRYGIDQTMDMTSRFSNDRYTAAYCLMAEGVEGHNTGSITGNQNSSGQEYGRITWARNMYYNISHRFPNASGRYTLSDSDSGIEVYNQLISNHNTRMMALNGNLKVDYFKNYGSGGNKPPLSTAIGKIHLIDAQTTGGTMQIYSTDNFYEGIGENPTDNPQKWRWRKGKPDPCTKGVNCDFFDGDEVVDNEIADSPSLYSTTQQHNWTPPSDGYWDYADVETKVTDAVGHCRGINTDGTPGFFRDDKDADYINKVLTNTTESTYRTSGSWDDSTFPGTALYADTDGDFMPDWFENQHAHLNPNDAADRDLQHTNWTFVGYTVTNDAGYSNIEICAEFYANGFAEMVPDEPGPTPAEAGSIILSRRKQ